MQTLNENTVTDAVVGQMTNTPNPRFKEIMNAAVRHLHAFAHARRNLHDLTRWHVRTLRPVRLRERHHLRHAEQIITSSDIGNPLSRTS